MTTAHRRIAKSNPKVAAVKDSTPKAIAHRPSGPGPAKPALPTPLAPLAARSACPAQSVEKAYVVEVEDLALEVSEISPFKTAFFNSIAKVKALTAQNNIRAVDGKKRTLAQARGYSRDDLFAVAEIGYHYLFSGGLTLALTIFEGLNAIAPEEAYFALALGLTHDHLDNRTEANKWYKLAAELDPSDGRPDVNRAELFLQAGDRKSAVKLLQRGAQKSRTRGDQALARKAMALIHHLEHTA